MRIQDTLVSKITSLTLSLALLVNPFLGLFYPQPAFANDDDTGPEAPQITFPNPEQYFNSSPILNQWTPVTDPSGIKEYRVQYEYDDHHTFSGYPYRTETGTSRNHKPASWEQGGVSFRVQAIDNADNYGEWSAWRHYYYDSIPPASPDLVWPADGSLIKRSDAILDWSDVSDPSGPVTYNYKSSWTGGGSYGPVSTGINSFINATGSQDRTYYWQVQACDLAGNCSAWSGPWEVTIDGTPPSKPTSLTIYKGHNPSTRVEVGCGGYTNDPKITIDWAPNSEADLAYYWFGTKFNKYHHKVYPPTTEYHGNMTPGNNPYHYTVIAVDKAGNESPISNQCGPLTLDQEAPVVEITSPTSDLLSGVIPIRGTVIDGNPHHYWLVIDGPGGRLSPSQVGATSGINYNVVNDSASFTDKLFFKWDNTKVPDGAYIIKLEARDAADNKDATSVHWMTVRVDNTPATITNVAADKAYVRAGDILTITAEVIDPSGIAAVSADFSYNLAYSSRPNPTSVAMHNVGGNTYRVAYIVPAGWNEGTMYIKVAARDRTTGGNWIRSAETNSVIVDNTAPSITIDSPLPGFVKDGVKVYGSIDDANPYYYRLSIIGMVNETLVEASGSASKINELLYDRWATNKKKNKQRVYPDGLYIILLEAWDLVGNYSASTTEVIVDNTLPTSVITFPTNGGNGSTIYLNNWDGVVSGTADDENGIQKVVIKIQRTSDGKYWRGTKWGNSKWNLAGGTNVWTYSVLSGLSPTDDAYIITSRATDLASNVESTYTVTVVYDATAPRVDLTNPGNDAFLSGEVEVTGVIDEINPRNYSLSLHIGHDPEAAWKDWYGNPSERRDIPWYQSGGTVNNVSYILDTKSISEDPRFGDGEYIIRFAARDRAGNRDPMANTGTGDSVIFVPITIDNTAPESAPTSPGAGYYNTWNGSIAGWASDATAGVEKVEVKIEVITPEGDTKYWDGSGWVDGEVWLEATGTIDWTYNITPIEGTYTFYSRATDNAGNTELTGELTGIVYDTTSPVIEGLDGLTAEEFIAGDFISLRFTDNLSGVNYDEGPIITYEGGSVGTFSKATWDTVLLPPGNYKVTVTIKDRAGNPVTEEVSVNINVLITYSPIDSDKGIYDLTISWQTGWQTWGMVVYDVVPHLTLDLSDANFGYAYSSGKVDEDPKTTSHSVTITGLKADTIYYFRLINGGSPTVISDEFSESTLALPAPTPGMVLAVFTSRGGSRIGGSILGTETQDQEEEIAQGEEEIGEVYGEGDEPADTQDADDEEIGWYWYLIAAILIIVFLNYISRRRKSR